MKKLIILLTFLSITFSSLSQRIIGGDLSFEWVSNYTYEITVSLYYIDTIYGNDFIIIEYGDGISDTIPQIDTICYPNHISKKTFVFSHTYPGPGNYQLIATGDNWIAYIQNIQSSDHEPFQASSTINISATQLNNNSIILNSYGFDTAFVNQSYFYNPSAFDSDGDSISYKLKPCIVGNYSYPVASNIIEIDSISGDFIWENPLSTGLYSICIEVCEWRAGIKIASTIRQMTINVIEPSSIENNFAKSNRIRVFPNPFDNILNISSDFSSQLYVAIIDISGKIIFEKSVSKNKNIDLSHLSSGIYFYKVFVMERLIETGKLIKK